MSQRLPLFAALALAACESPILVVYDGGAIGDATAEPDATPSCAKLSVASFPYSVDAGSSALAAIGGSKAIFATSSTNPSYYQISDQGPQPIHTWSTPHFVPLSMAARGSELWFGAADGSLRRAMAADSTLPQVATASAPEGLRWLAVAPEGHPFELFLLGDPGQNNALYRFDGRTIRRLWTRTASVDPNERGEGGLAWAAEGEAFALPRGGRCSAAVPRCVLHVRAGDQVLEEPVPLLSDPLSAIAVLPRLGALAGTAGGRILSYDGSAWQVLGFQITQGHPLLRAFLPLDEGYLFLTDRWAGQWSPTLKFSCDLTSIGRDPDLVLSAAQLSDRFILTGIAEIDGPPGSVSVLTRSP